MSSGGKELRRYLGVDLVGSSGKSGCVYLEEVREPISSRGEESKRRGRSQEPKGDGFVLVGLHAHAREPGYPGLLGLEQLIDLGRSAAACAIDAPFGFPLRTLALLNGESISEQPELEDMRFRVTDRAMRARLAFMQLNRNYVTTPLRLEYMRRALMLVEQSGQKIPDARMGQGRWLETHPRLCVTEFLANGTRGLNPFAVQKLVSDYRRTDSKHREDAFEARRTILYGLGQEFRQRVGKGFFRVDGWRNIAEEPTSFDALFCAFAAYAHALEVEQTYPETLATGVARIEGWARVPDWSRMFDAVATRARG